MKANTIRPSRFRLPIVSTCISLAVITLYLIVGAIPESLIWHQAEGFRIWQWLSAHFVHINAEHMTLNLIAFMILASIIEQTSRKVLGLALFSGIVGVNVYLTSLFQMDAYAGLSGALNALLITALYFLYKQPGYRAASILTLIGSIAKIIAESIWDFSLFSSLPWPAVPQAHLAGLIGGGLLIAFLEIRKKRLMKSDLVRFDDLTPESRLQ